MSAGLYGTRELRVGSLTTADTIVMGTFESNAAYSDGYLLFVRSGSLMAQSFNKESRTLGGDPLNLGREVNFDIPSKQAFSVSATGRLVFLPAARTKAQLTWLDRTGRSVGTVGNPGGFGNLDLSPGGQRLAADLMTPRPGAKTGVRQLADGSANWNNDASDG